MKAKRIHYLLSIVLVVALSLVVATTANSQEVEVGDGVVITATVVAIDKADRTVTLKGPKGKAVTLEVSQAARNFDQVDVGDQVKVEYYQSVAMHLGKPGEKPDASAGLVTARSAKGDKPAGVAMEVVDVSATVEAIDRTHRIVTLKLPHGHMISSRVDPSVKAFDTLSVGDTVHARYTKAIAISVDTP